MRSYELTERGKIVIAVLIVLLLLAMSVILMIKAFANQAGLPPDDSHSAVTDTPNQPPEETSPSTPTDATPSSPSESPTTASETPPTTTNSPPPSGGGFTPPDNSPTPDSTPTPDNSPTPDNGTEGNGQSGGSEETTPPETIETVVIGGNPSEGTVSFLVPAESQSPLDPAMLDALSEFVNSPNLTLNRKIIIETTAVPGGDATALTNAIVSALAARGVAQNRIEHIQRPSGTNRDIVEVNLYFTSLSGK